MGILLHLGPHSISSIMGPDNNTQYFIIKPYVAALSPSKPYAAIRALSKPTVLHS